MTERSSGEPRWVSVGRVGRPHGRDGSFVVEGASDDPDRFRPGARVFVDREPAVVAGSKRAGGRTVVRLDRAARRGAALELPAGDLPPLPEGEFYAFQLVGLAVEEEGGRRLGTVAEVAPGVANDVLELDSGLSLPFVEDCVRTIELDRGRIVITAGFVAS